MKKGLVLGIILVFIITAVSPMVIGYNAEPTEINKHLADLRFVCSDVNGFSEKRYEYYKEKLLSQYSSDNSNDDMIAGSEKEESKILVEPPPIPVSSGPMDSPWPMQSHDTHHTGRSPYSTANVTGLEKWRFHFSGWLEDTPVIDSDGTIYCKGAYNALDRYLYAIYPDGTEKWKYKTDGLILGSSPAIVEDGTIYVGSWDGFLHAINFDGTQKWKFSANGANIASSPAIAEDSTINFGTLWSLGDGGKIHAVNPNGTEKWRYQTGDAVTSDPAIGDDGTIYIGSCDGYLYAMNTNGTLKWRFKTNDWIQGHPSIAEDGTIYIGSFDDYLYALYPNNGTMRWKYPVGPGTETNPSIGSDGAIYVGSDRLYAVYSDGTKKWSFNPGADRFIGSSSPAISADGTIYIGVEIGQMGGGEIIAVNPEGTEKWRKKVANDWVDSSPSIAEDGTVYIGSSYEMSRGYLHAFGSVESNSPPGAPSISGTTNGKVGVDYWYTFVAHDPDNNPIQL